MQADIDTFLQAHLPVVRFKHANVCIDMCKYTLIEMHVRTYVYKYILLCYRPRNPQHRSAHGHESHDHGGSLRRRQ